MHVVITDSGLGGLGICAAIENAVRHSSQGGGVALTYFNAWPEQGRGYNSMPDEASRVASFDCALTRMGQLRPDRIVIACNTLSVLFPLTRYAVSSPIPVVGIIDAGVALFSEALDADPQSSIALFGTRITMDSGVHRDRLLQRGVAAARVVSVPSHGLAAAIEKDAGGVEVERLIDECASQAAALLPREGPVLAGLCCTHYGYVADQFRFSLERALGRPAQILDPNDAMVRFLTPVLTIELSGAEAVTPGSSSGAVSVAVISKVSLDERTRAGIGRLVAPISAATADALLAYTHVPDLF